MKPLIGSILLALSCVCLAMESEVIPYAAKGRVPSGYPAEYSATIAAAENEARLVIYSTTDLRLARDLVDDFGQLYPRIEVDYQDLNSTELHHRFLAETVLGQESADVVWSSAMDQQFILVDKGYAQAYNSPELAMLPDWAVWKSQAFGTTYEPVAIVYNKRELPLDEIPLSHADLTRLLNAKPERFNGNIVTYNIEKSGLGFLLATQDAAASQGFWELAKALGNSAVRLQLTTDAMMKRVSSGQDLIAYNVLGSYAFAEAQKDPSIGYVFPKDYTLVVSRIAFISRKAKHANAAKLWLDYLLSTRGQTIIANRSRLFSLRVDVEGETTAVALKQVLGESARPIAVGPGLLSYQDETRYRQFLEQWRLAVVKR